MKNMWSIVVALFLASFGERGKAAERSEVATVDVKEQAAHSDGKGNAFKISKCRVIEFSDVEIEILKISVEGALDGKITLYAVRDGFVEEVVEAEIEELVDEGEILIKLGEDIELDFELDSKKFYVSSRPYALKGRREGKYTIETGAIIKESKEMILWGCTYWEDEHVGSYSIANGGDLEKITETSKDNPELRIFALCFEFEPHQ